MKPSVYVETTVISYLAARPSRDVVVAGHQRITHDWWASAHERFDLLASQLVVEEASAGDPEAVDARMRLLDTFTPVETTVEAVRLADRLVRTGAVPVAAKQDALHIAVGTVNGADYLVTWNCRHIANATIRPLITKACNDAGFEPPIICTPEELLEPGDVRE